MGAWKRHKETPMNRIAIAAAVAVLAVSAMPNASEAHGRRHHHHHRGAVAVAAAPVADDCFLTRIVTRVTEGVGALVRCRT